MEFSPRGDGTVPFARGFARVARDGTGDGGAYTHLLAQFARVLSASNLAEEGMPALLALALDVTRRQRGLLGLFDSQGKLDELVTHGLDDHLPSDVMERMLEHPAVLVQPGLVPGEERLVASIGPGPLGVLLVEGSLPDAPQGEDCLPILEAVAELIWHRLREAGERQRLREELRQTRFAGSPSSVTVLASSRLVPTRFKLKQAARQDRSVFLQGEEGTEKEDLARYLHASSARPGPFVAFHADMVPSHRAQEELFGSGTTLEPHGCVQAAESGTLFIESPERLPPDAQERLVQYLDEGGSIRLVTCSTHNTTELVRTGKLHPMLAEQMQQVRVVVPPLRSQPNDITSLVDLILREMGSGPDGEPRAVTEKALQQLVSYPWPRNVRELRQVLETAAARAGTGPIMPKHLPDEVREQSCAPSLRFPTLKEVEKRYITEVIYSVRSKREASKVLGIAPSTLYEKLSRYGIQT